MTATIERAEFLSQVLGQDIGSGSILMIIPSHEDMSMLIHFMAEKEGFRSWDSPRRATR